MQKALTDRVIAILTKPKPTWSEIETEPVDVAAIYRSYIIPLAAIPAVAGFFGTMLFGIPAIGTTYRPPLLTQIVSTAVMYAIALGLVYVVALVIDWLAPRFGGRKDFNQALKLAAYSPTASWIAGIFSLIPSLSILGFIGGLYSLYLLYVGLPIMMKPPAEKTTIYFIAIIAIMFLVAIVLSILVMPILGLGMGLGAMR